MHLFEGFTAADRWDHGVGEPYHPDDLMVSLDPPLPAAHRAALRLHVCDATFDFSATRAESPHGPDEYDYVWGPSGLDWSSLSARTLAFSRPLNVCDRTPGVRDAIVTATGRTCESVTKQHLAAVRALSIAAGSLTDSGLKDGDFAGLTGTTRLNAQRTGLTALPAGIFDELTGLTTLDLSFNSLTALPARVFDKLTGLTTLFLQENDLTALPADVFEKLTALNSLRLEGNTIQPPYGIAVNAGSDSRVDGGDSVTLRGSTTGPWGDNVATWSWVQVDGESSNTAVTGSGAVTFTGADTATASFTAPTAGSSFDEIVLDFRLTVTGRARPSATASDWTRVTVNRRLNPGSPRSGFEARFENEPAEHDGSTPFEVELHFSPAPELGYRTLAGALDVTGGSVESAQRKTQGNNRAWRVTVRPTGYDSVTITLPARPCGKPNAVCVDGRPLATDVATVVPVAPAAQFEPSFSGAPAEHAGEGGFTVRFHLGAEPAGLSYRTVRDDLFAVTGGRIVAVKRETTGKNQDWELTVEPSGLGDVTLSLKDTTDCAGPPGVCTARGQKLTGPLSLTVRGPATLSVADARVEEAADAALAFVVTLSRARATATTVDYATSDGSAQAGVDYTAASGTLAFATGESSKTVEVAVLDDAHDEGEETLTLTLTNPSGGRVADGEATGTIENRDALPRALLARFGRTAAVHVVEHVEERLRAPREPGFRGRFAGRELQRGMERDFAFSFLRGLAGSAGANPNGVGVHDPMGSSPAAGAGSLGAPGLAGRGLGLAAAAGPMGAAGRPHDSPLGGGLLALGLGAGHLLTGSAFSLNRKTRQGGVLSFWSRGAQSYFSGRDGALSLGGDVRTTMFGADYAKGRMVAGLSLAHSRGLGTYAGGAGGQVASVVTGLYPWLGYRATERVTVWGVAGYGAGGMLLTPEGAPALASGLSMAMAAGGTRGALVAGGASGFELAFKADALWVGTSVDGVDGPAGRLKTSAAAATRFRTGLEATRDYALAGRLSLRPSVEVGLRHDGGDAETGAGMDIGGGLVVADASTGLAVDVRVRTLLVHQAEGFRERGMAVSFSYNPTPSTPLGFTAQVAPSWGGQATGGAEALWGRDSMAGMAHGSFAQGNRLDGEVGYGLPVGSRFVGTPRAGFSTSEHGGDYRVGYGLAVLDRERLNLELGVDVQHRESPLAGRTDRGVIGRATVTW